MRERWKLAAFGRFSRGLTEARSIDWCRPQARGAVSQAEAFFTGHHKPRSSQVGRIADKSTTEIMLLLEFNGWRGGG